MEVRVSLRWEIVVDGYVDLLDIDATAEDVGGDADALVEGLELLVSLDSVVEVRT
jgi:hypothetical protein